MGRVSLFQDIRYIVNFFLNSGLDVLLYVRLFYTIHAFVIAVFKQTSNIIFLYYLVDFRKGLHYHVIRLETST